MKLFLLLIASVTLIGQCAFAVRISNSSPATLIVTFSQFGNQISRNRVLANSSVNANVNAGNYDIQIDYTPRMVYQNQHLLTYNNTPVSPGLQISINSTGQDMPLVARISDAQE